MDKFGYPVLPTPETYVSKSSDYKKVLIGKFMTNTYRA
jgi:hypothetical protein